MNVRTWSDVSVTGLTKADKSSYLSPIGKPGLDRVMGKEIHFRTDRSSISIPSLPFTVYIDITASGLFPNNSENIHIEER